MELKTSKKSLWKGLSGVLNYIMLPIFLVGILSVLVIYFSTPKGKMPHILGLSIVSIRSESMKEAGFEVGDVVFVNQNKTKNLQKGDIVAFYKNEDAYDKQKYAFASLGDVSSSSLVPINEFEGEFASSVNYQGTSRTTPQKLQQKQEAIYFHFIDDVYVSPDGIIFYKTKGSKPGVAPDGLIRQDFIVAKYVNTPNFIKVPMSFVLTPKGMVFFIVLPLSIIAGYECFVLLKKINTYLFEGKVFSRKMSYKDPVLKNYDVAQVMTLPRKAYFWVTSTKQEKPQVFEFLFKVNAKSSKKAYNQRQTALAAKKVFESKGPLEYFKFWHSSLKGYFDKKELLKLEKLYQQFLKEKSHN